MHWPFSKVPLLATTTATLCGLLAVYYFLLACLAFLFSQIGLPVECVSRGRTYLLIEKLTTSEALSMPQGKKDRRATCSTTHCIEQQLWVMNHFAPNIRVETTRQVDWHLRPICVHAVQFTLQLRSSVSSTNSFLTVRYVKNSYLSLEGMVSKNVFKRRVFFTSTTIEMVKLRFK